MDRAIACVAMLSAIMLLSACTPVFDPRDSSVESDAEVRRSVAMTFGAQSGLAWKAESINKTLENQASKLDKIYNFNVLMMKNNMLPPVIQESVNTMNIDTPDKMRMADKEIQIIRPAQLVTSAPTWRDYLIMSYATPEKPDASTIPKNAQQRRLWKQSYEKGWQQGIKQAQDIFAQSLGMLNRDYNGMILYHTLLTQNMMTSAYTSKAQLGVTGDENTMRINDQVLRITETAKLNAGRPEDWHAIIDMNDE